MVERRDRVLAPDLAGVLRDDAARRQPVDALERLHVLAQRRRGLEQLEEAGAVDLDEAQLGLGDHGRAAPGLAHERELADAAPLRHAPDELAALAALLVDRRGAGRDEVDAVGLVSLTEEDLPRSERPLGGAGAGSKQGAERGAAQRAVAGVARRDLVQPLVDGPVARRVVRERRAVDADEHRGLGRADGRRPDPGARERRLLAQQPSRAEAGEHELVAVAARHDDLHRALDDDVEGERLVALAEQPLAPRELDPLGVSEQVVDARVQRREVAAGPQRVAQGLALGHVGHAEPVDLKQLELDGLVLLSALGAQERDGAAELLAERAQGRPAADVREAEQDAPGGRQVAGRVGEKASVGLEAGVEERVVQLRLVDGLGLRLDVVRVPEDEVEALAGLERREQVGVRDADAVGDAVALGVAARVLDGRGADVQRDGGAARERGGHGGDARAAADLEEAAARGVRDPARQEARSRRCSSARRRPARAPSACREA